MPESIYWYDFETTGIDPVLDRAIQFAGVRTDLDLNIVDEPLNIFCQPGSDVIPSPEAIAVTGILMSELQQRGLTEAEFSKKVLEQFSIPQTCVAGYNSIRFDDEFTRQMLYRNFFEPYSREWQGGNSRWDVIDMLRMGYALRPDGLNWPVNDQGVPSFRLELLTEANGIGHEDAHDAVSDVIATIELVKLFRQKQGKLYDYLYNLRSKKQVLQQLYPLGKTAIIHVSSMYPASRGCLSVVLPLCTHPTNSNGIICFDLSEDPSPLIDLTSVEIARRVFTPRDQLLEGESRIPLKTIHINRCPAIAPLATLNNERAEYLGISHLICQEHLAEIQHASGIVEKIVDAYESHQFAQVSDPDHMLYAGEFFGASDVATMAELRAVDPSRLPEFYGRFQDDRLDEMLFRYRARNYPALLNDEEASRWRQFKLAKWQDGDDLQDAIAKIDSLVKQKGDLACLASLRDYIVYLESSVASE